MPFTNNIRKTLTVILAGSSVVYMIKQYQQEKAPIEEMFHAETDTTPVPIPSENQPGNMENDQLRST
ncbi:hypothetical protein BC941DRAFT_467782 [Chlamydoabsidia padenii]|nr:hypothetical protein BC941DRAFT_467782 [Chlamydoabsidia padenii]